MGQEFRVNCERTKEGFKAYIDNLFEEHKYLTFEWRTGKQRTLSMNALFHVWLAEYLAYILGVHKKTIDASQMEGIKRTIKKLYYIETGNKFMIHEIYDYSPKFLTPAAEPIKKKDYTSSASWTRGEKFEVLGFLQRLAAERGCVLESEGEHKKLTEGINK